MATQVSTSHTVHARPHNTPLRVPKRPPRTDVTQAIHKFLPYAVVFLLSLMLYSSLKTSKITYPPYSPPNVGEEFTHLPSTSVDIASFLNRRMETLEDLKRRSNAKDVNTGHWATWRTQKMNELSEKKKAAEMQATQGIGSIPFVVGNAFEQAKRSGGKMVDEVKVFGAEKLADTQDFAYDAMYAWKQRAGEWKDVAANKLGEARESFMDRAEGIKVGVSQAAYDLKFRNMAMELLRTEPYNRLIRNSTSRLFADRLASFVSSIKDSLRMNEDARHVVAMRDEWEQIDVSKRADMIIQQLHFLGDHVIEEVFRKLDHERSQCVCLEEQRAVCY